MGDFQCKVRIADYRLVSVFDISRRAQTTRFVAGLVVGIITFPLAFYFYFATGGAPVATAEAAMPFEKTLAHKALNARIRKEMPMNAPIQGDEPNLTAGARI